MTKKILPRAEIDFITFRLWILKNKYEPCTIFFYHSDKVFKLLLLYQSGIYLVRHIFSKVGRTADKPVLKSGIICALEDANEYSKPCIKLM